MEANGSAAQVGPEASRPGCIGTVPLPDDDTPMSKLQWQGYTELSTGMPTNWEVRYVIERLHTKYHARILDFFDKHKKDWLKGDNGDEAPGAARPGGLVARMCNEQQLKDTGVFVYAAHPSQSQTYDKVKDDYAYTGPRWYVTCMEAIMKRYKSRGVAPPPPPELQHIMWPRYADRRRPWLTEAGWTIVPENSDPQAMHADICSEDAPHPRKPGQGRYHHFVWKLRPGDVCTTNIVPGAFTEGTTKEEHFDKWKVTSSECMIFDSEMLHRGGRSKPISESGTAWTSTMTLQLCCGTGWNALNTLVSKGLMWYTQPIGWETGDAVDAFVKELWQPAIVSSRSSDGIYEVFLSSAAILSNDSIAKGLKDCELRYRQSSGPLVDTNAAAIVFTPGKLVEAFFEGDWYAAKIARVHDDGTCKVVWSSGQRSFTDGLPQSAVRLPEHGALKKRRLRADDGESPSKRLRTSDDGSASTTAESGSDEDAKPHIAQPEAAAIISQLLTCGVVELPGGLPTSWRQWSLLGYIEAYYDAFNGVIMRELAMLQSFWKPLEGSSQRHGAFAAAKISERLQDYGVAIYSPGDSQEEKPGADGTYRHSGPRWYVSITQAVQTQLVARRHHPQAEAALTELAIAAPMPANMRKVICGHPEDHAGQLRLRGLGWTLAPAGSDPQALHADIWGIGKHARTDKTRWPHVLWKRDAKQCCTTQVVPGAFTQGDIAPHHFDSIRQAKAPAIIVDSEALHRGGPTPAVPIDGADNKVSWMSTLSLEFCTASGWDAWEEQMTGGTTKDPTSTQDWRMLCVAGSETQNPGSLKAAANVVVPLVDLPVAPWLSPKGKENLRIEQREWEFSTG